MPLTARVPRQIPRPPVLPSLAARGFLALACLALGPVVPAQGVEATTHQTGQDMFEPAIMAVTVNGTPRGTLFIQRTSTGRRAVRREDLPSIGLEVAAPATVLIDGAEHVALDTVTGLAWAVDEPSQSLAITAEPRLLARTVIPAAPTHRGLAHTAGEGAFLNWAIEQAVDSGSAHTPATLALEAGARFGPVLLLSRGQTIADESGRSRFVRLMSSASWDLPEQPARVTLGDLVATSDELGQGVWLGGLSYATLARLDPYRIRYPLGTVQGQALLPSEVEVYVDGQRVRTERVPAGVFEIRDLNTPPGAQSVQLRVRDVYGRVQRFDQSLYASPRLLAPGMHDVQYAVGALRRRFGQDSADYGSPAFSARHAWGASPALTLGLRAEGRPGFTAAGASLTLRVATAGLLSAALAASHAREARGHAGLLRYEYQSARWGLSMTRRADSPGYATLGEFQALGHRRLDTQVYASRSLDAGHSLWISDSRLTTHPAPREPLPAGWRFAPLTPGRVRSIGYGAALRPWGGSLRLAASRLEDGRGPRHELSVSLVFLLGGGALLAAQARQGPEGGSQSVQWTRPPPAQEGWGYDVGVTREGAAQDAAVHWRAATQLEASALRLRADLSGGTRAHMGTLRVSAAGALAFIGERWYLSRPLEDSYAVVQVGEVAGVPVTVNGVLAGVTDTRGQRFISQVGAHHDTVFGIDARAIPLDQTIPDLQRRVVVAERSGAVVRFETRRLRTVSAQLLTSGGQPLARARVWVGTGTQAVETFTGPQGELYLENLPPGAHHGAAEPPQGRCQFDLVMPRTDDVLTELGALTCTPAPRDQNRSDAPR